MLRDGTRVRIRSVRAEDRSSLLEFLETVSQDSRSLRFFSCLRTEMIVPSLLGDDAGAGCVAVVMETDDRTPPQILAHAEYVPDPKDRSRAEVAFLVADTWQGKGAASLLLGHLARVARAAGIATFEAYTERVNAAMLDVFLNSGFPCAVSVQFGEAFVTLDLAAGRRRSPDPSSPVRERSAAAR